MLKRPRYLILGLVILSVLVVLNLPSHTAAQIKLAIGGFFLPLFGLANSAHHLGTKAEQTFVSRATLLKQLEQLRQENQNLRLLALQGEEARRENDRFRDLLGQSRKLPWKHKLARVIGRDPANWWRTVQIDVGSRDGVRTNLTVMTGEGLVGRVSAVGYSRSQVLLVGDPNCRVGAMIQETRDATGVVVPSLGESVDTSLVDLTCIPRNCTLKPGQLVVTSGQGGIFPKGITVGHVVDTRTIDYGLYLEARVKLAVNFNRLEDVWVLWP